jgi:hypothetical protein
VTVGVPDGAGFTAASHLGWWVLAACGAVVAALGVLTTTGWATSSATRITARFSVELAR